MKFFLYVMGFVVLYKIPLFFWERCYFFLFEKKKNISLKFCHELQKYQGGIHTGNWNNSLTDLTHYKFYTAISLTLIKYSRQWGAPCLDFLGEIRAAVIKDDQFERRIKMEKISSLLQFSLISLITICFTFLVSSMLKIKFSTPLLVFLATWQCLGFFLFLQLEKRVKEKKFAPFSLSLKTLYSLRTLLKAGIPFSKIQEESSFNLYTENMREKELQPVVERMLIAWEELQKKGRPLHEEWQALIDEVWFLQDLRFEKFVRWCQGLKLFIMMFFFLSTYFMLLFSLFKQVV